MIFWPLLTVVFSLWLLPKVKGAFIAAQIFLNDKKIERKTVRTDYKIRCGNYDLKVNAYQETLPNGKKYISLI